MEWKNLTPLFIALHDEKTFPLACLQSEIDDPVRLGVLQLNLRSFERAEQAFPSNVSLNKMTGQLYCLAGERGKALSNFNAVQSVSPGETLTSLQLLALFEQADNQSALQNLLVQGNVSSEQLVLIARDLANNGKLSQSVEWCQWATQKDPREPQVWDTWILIGAKYEAVKEWGLALEVIRAALAAQDQYGVGIYRASFYVHEGIYLTEQNRPDLEETAIDAYDRAIADGHFRADWEHASAYTARAEWFRSHKSKYPKELALADYEKAFHLYPQSINALLMVGVVYQQDYQDLFQAEKIFRQAIMLFPQSPYGYYYLGGVLIKTGDIQGAVEAYTKALDLNPGWKAATDGLQTAQKRLQGQPAP